MPLPIRTIGVGAALALVASLAAVALPAPSSAQPSPPSRPSPPVVNVGIGGQPDGGLAVQLSVDGQGDPSTALPVVAGDAVRPAVVLGPPSPPATVPAVALATARPAAEPSPGGQGVLVDLGVNGVHGLDLRGGGNGGGIVTLQVAIADRPLVSLGEPAPGSGDRPAPLNLPGLSLDLGGLLRG